MLRIIDNKRVSLTDSEFRVYQDICKSYDGPKFKGADLFKDLFETDEHGTIVFLRPPNKAYTSMEVYLFLVNIFIHQHLRISCNKVDILAAEMQTTLAESKSVLQDLKTMRSQLLETNSNS